MGILQYNRQKNFFDGVGSKVESNNLEEIIKLAKMDYTVRKEPLFFGDGKQLENKWATCATIDGEDVTFGIVGDQYTILQNFEAFDFLQDVFRTGELQIECAGTVEGGKRSFICAKTEPIKVMDDDIDPYMVIMNSFDGSGSVKVMFTPVRVFCSNCEVVATKKAAQKLYVKHSKRIHDQLYIAKDVLLANTNYLEAYKEEMEELTRIRYSRRQFAGELTEAILRKMYLVGTADNPIERKRESALVERYRDELLQCWSKNDLANYENTAYAAIQAVMDWETHSLPGRNTGNNELFFSRAVAGMVISNYALNYIKGSVV